MPKKKIIKRTVKKRTPVRKGKKRGPKKGSRISKIGKTRRYNTPKTQAIQDVATGLMLGRRRVQAKRKRRK